MTRPVVHATASASFAPGHPLRASTIAHAGLEILGPMLGEQVDALLDMASLPPAGRALDIGCGKGDLLVRLARRGLAGTGVDRNGAFLEAARGSASAAGVGDLVSLLHADAADLASELVATGGYDLVAAIGSTGALGGPLDAPARLASLTRPGGVVLIGEGFWRRPPTAAQLAEFGIEPDELVDRGATLARMTAPGLTLLAAVDASSDGWDAYEAAYADSLESWANANPNDPDAERLAALAGQFRGTWQGWRREAMGFVTAVLRVPAA